MKFIAHKAARKVKKVCICNSLNLKIVNNLYENKKHTK